MSQYFHVDMHGIKEISREEAIHKISHVMDYFAGAMTELAGITSDPALQQIFNGFTVDCGDSDVADLIEAEMRDRDALTRKSDDMVTRVTRKGTAVTLSVEIG